MQTIKNNLAQENVAVIDEEWVGEDAFFAHTHAYVENGKLIAHALLETGVEDGLVTVHILEIKAEELGTADSEEAIAKIYTQIISDFKGQGFERLDGEFFGKQKDYLVSIGAYLTHEGNDNQLELKL